MTHKQSEAGGKRKMGIEQILEQEQIDQEFESVFLDNFWEILA